MKAIGVSDVGVTRTNNEDYYLLCQSNDLYVVADGMGGHKAGEVASKLACESIVSGLKALSTVEDTEFSSALDSVLFTANQTLLDYVKENPNCKGMGTTVVVVYRKRDHLHVLNIGDSRCYGLSNGELIQLTKDHSLVAELVKMGSISQEEALTHPDRNIITSALGVSEQYEVHKARYDVNQFEQLLICTDGLTNMVDTDSIYKVLTDETFEAVPQTLVDMANENGGKDNITVVCIEV
ncbi:Stp1/IreP family PP2C-type Ser/Thr phosphatase [Fusibacter sp. JL298sf-3]